jgi:hypothetical protein
MIFCILFLCVLSGTACAFSSNTDIGLSVRAVPGETFGKTWKITWKGNIERINFSECFNTYLDADDAFFQGGTAVTVAIPVRKGDIGMRGRIFKRSGKVREFLFYLDVGTGKVSILPVQEDK